VIECCCPYQVINGEHKRARGLAIQAERNRTHFATQSGNSLHHIGRVQGSPGAQLETAARSIGEDNSIPHAPDVRRETDRVSSSVLYLPLIGFEMILSRIDAKE
jgi:hypothetical protein